MARIEVKIPAMGEGIIEVTLLKWLVNTGDIVEAEQPLAEVATDKVNTELFSPVKGSLVKMIYHEGEVPKVGEIIAIIETAEDGLTVGEKSPPLLTTREPGAPDRQSSHEKRIPVPSFSEKKDSPGDSVSFLSPFVRHLARQRGISAAELKQIRGTGSAGRVCKDDIIQYIRTGRLHRDHNQLIPEKESEQIPSETSPAENTTEVQRVPMDRMRKLIAAHMVQSKRTSPHVTSFAEADVTVMADWRNRVKDRFLAGERIPLTYTPLFVEIVARVLKEFPGINVSVDGDSVLQKKNINIGIATVLKDGNLIVPVIKNADRENLYGLTKIISDLVSRARENRLLPAEITGGTFTITNIGQYKSLTGTPIINQPEAAILAIGAIAKKPWAVKTAAGFGLAIRDIIMLSLTYDHRVIDGALGGSFLSRIIWHLENFDASREL
jgi:2-oxoglutarate dehydrogenase E2 component (dihydrolipoamide succinyltransferase)